MASVGYFFTATGLRAARKRSRNTPPHLTATPKTNGTGSTAYPRGTLLLHPLPEEASATRLRLAPPQSRRGCCRPRCRNEEVPPGEANNPSPLRQPTPPRTGYPPPLSPKAGQEVLESPATSELVRVHGVRCFRVALGCPR